MLEDKILVYRLKNGDESAFDKLYYKYAPLIKYIIYDITKRSDVIEDICQTVFMKLWENIKNFKGGSFKYYLIQIAKNESKNYLRSRQIEDKYLENLDFFTLYNLDTGIWQQVRDKLDKTEQRIIILHFIYGVSFSEIANIINIKKTTCFYIYKKALAKMKQYYKGDEC